MERGGQTLEGESPLLKDGALPLQASLTHRELPRKTPPFTKRRFVSLFVMAGSGGEVFVVLGGAVLLQSAASRPFCEWELLRGICGSIKTVTL